MTTKLVYPATFKHDGEYVPVKFLDLPAAMTRADSIEQAYEMAEEVLGLVLEDKKKFLKIPLLRIFKKNFAINKLC